MDTPDRRLPRDGRRILTLVCAGCCLAIVLGFLGEVARPLDSFSHFRAHLGASAAVLALIAIAMRRWLLAGALVVAAVAGLFFSLPWLVLRPGDAPDGARYTLLQMNLRWDAGDKAEALRRVAEADADIVTLQEMTPEWVAFFAPLAERYPYQVHCDGADGFHGDSALLSRRPFVPGAATICDERNSLAAARIDFNGVALTVASHHQLWPWPRGQWQRFDRLRPTLEALPRPVLIAGDFNAVPWSDFVNAYAKATEGRVQPGIGPVWSPPFVPDALRRTIGLPLNNLVASPQVGVASVARLPSTSSDHLPVLVRFTVARSADDGPRVSVAGR